MNNNYFREISGYDLFFHILQRWRLILVCLIAGAVLIGLGGSIKAMNSSSNITEEQANEALVGIDDERRVIVESTADSIKAYQKACNEQMDYNDNSLFMKLDPNNLVIGSLQYYVDNNQQTEWNNQLGAMVKMYVAALSCNSVGDALSQALTDIYNVDEEYYYYYKDLISVNSENFDTGIFSVTVYGNSLDETQALIDSIKTIVDNQTEAVSKKLGPHKISLIEDNLYFDKNSGVQSQQNTFRKNVLDYYSSIEKLKSSITDDSETVYLQYLIQDIEKEKMGTFVISKLYIVIGVLLGIVVAILCIVFKYVFSHVLKVANELETVLKIPVLAKIQGENKFTKKHHLKLDKWLKRKKIRDNAKTSYEEKINVVASTLKAEFEHNKLNNICIICSFDCDESIVNDLRNIIGDTGKLSFVNNALSNTNTASMIADSDATVILEQTEVSMFQDIINEQLICSRYNSKILGSIVIQ